MTPLAVISSSSRPVKHERRRARRNELQRQRPFLGACRSVRGFPAYVSRSTFRFHSITDEIDAIVNHYYADIVGSDWPPEWRWVEEGYKTLAFPFDEITPPPFQMVHRWDLSQVLGYLGSWSATQRYQKRTGADPLELIRGELTSAWGDPGAPRDVTWPLHLRVGRVNPPS